jgi:hypothetical protein
MSVSLTFRCPDDLGALIASQVEATGQDKTSVVVGMLRSSLPSLLLMEKNNLPEIPAIYLVWVSNKLLYIGKTSDLKDRFRQHHRIANFLEAGSDARIAWFPLESNEQPSLEGDLIELLEPELNCNIPGKPKKLFTIRLKDDELAALEARRLPDESLGQAAARLLMEIAKDPSLLKKPTNVDNLEELIDKRLEIGLAEVRSQLEELRGKSKAR